MPYGDAPLTDRQWVPCRNNAGETIPAFGVVCIGRSIVSDTMRNGFQVPNVIQLTEANFCRCQLLVNGPSDVAAGGFGRFSTAANPIFALINTALVAQPLSAECYGPAPDTYKLCPGLPGFRVFGQISEAEGALNRDYVRVIQDTSSLYWAKATANWSSGAGDGSTVTAKAATPGYVYNGAGSWPDIDITVNLPRSGTDKDPNIETDDFFCYRPDTDVADGHDLIAVSNYLDDQIGTVKLTTNASAPQGWAIMDGTANGAGNGGSGYDMTGRFAIGLDSGDSDFDALGETGGAKTHTHGTTAVTATGAVSAYTGSANHMPPFLTLKYIERLDNSA